MKNKKILYCASTASHLKNFHLPYIKQLQELGYHITLCVNTSCDFPFIDDVQVIPFHKQIMSIENVKNIFRVYRLLKQERYTAISVHTTLAGAIVRAAVLLLPKKDRPKVFYTCHGYLFNDDDSASKLKYLIPEKICAPVTDILMVMNQKDEEIAKRYQLYNNTHNKLSFIPGMGVNFSAFDISQDKSELRTKYGVAEDAVLFVFAGEFSNRKRQEFLIKAFAIVAKEMPKAKLLLAGDGVLLDNCKLLVQNLQLKQQVFFLGYVTNMPHLYRLSDICVSASRIEGLPFNIMEAMYCEIPCIASDIKGHNDLIVSGENGYLFESEQELAQQMLALYTDTELRCQMAHKAKESILPYSLDNVLPIIMQIYDENL